MKQLLIFVTEQAVVLIDAIALVVILIGTIEAAWTGARAVLNSAPGHERRDIWLRYARWLVAGLTFQLAADIIETSITASWEAVIRLAAIAVVRTFLDYFLERDLAEVRARQSEPLAEGQSPKREQMRGILARKEEAQ